jgi:hypothetical protein
MSSLSLVLSRVLRIGHRSSPFSWKYTGCSRRNVHHVKLWGSDSPKYVQRRHLLADLAIYNPYKKSFPSVKFVHETDGMRWDQLWTFTQLLPPVAGFSTRDTTPSFTMRRTAASFEICYFDIGGDTIDCVCNFWVLWNYLVFSNMFPLGRSIRYSKVLYVFLGLGKIKRKMFFFFSVLTTWI